MGKIYNFILKIKCPSSESKDLILQYYTLLYKIKFTVRITSIIVNRSLKSHLMVPYLIAILHL